MGVILNETGEQHEWTLTEHRITCLLIDPSSVRLQSWELSGELEVRLGAEFSLALPGGEPRLLDPERTTSLAPLLGLMGEEITRIRIARSGVLALELAGGATFAVHPHPAYEAWEMEMVRDTERVGCLCAPGGGSPWG